MVLCVYALKMIFQEPDVQVPSPLSHQLHACIPPAVPTRFNIYPTLNNRCTGLHQQDSLYLGGGRKCGQPWRGGTAPHAGLVATCITLDISCKLIPHCADKVKTVAVACHCLLCAIAFCSLNFLSHCVSWRAVESSIGLTGCSA